MADDLQESLTVRRLQRQAPSHSGEFELWVVTFTSGNTEIIGMTLDEAVYVEENGYEGRIRIANEAEQTQVQQQALQAVADNPPPQPEGRAPYPIGRDAPVTAPFFTGGQRVEDMTDQELYNIGVHYNFTQLPNPPFTTRQRQRLIASIQEEQRTDFIYTGSSSLANEQPIERTMRRRPKDQVQQVEGDYVVQWDLDGPWRDLAGFARLADAEAARDNYIRRYADSGLEPENFRIVFRGETGGILIPRGYG